jgi:hypothetical protein
MKSNVSTSLRTLNRCVDSLVTHSEESMFMIFSLLFIIVQIVDVDRLYSRVRPATLTPRFLYSIILRFTSKDIFTLLWLSSRDVFRRHSCKGFIKLFNTNICRLVPCLLVFLHTSAKRLGEDCLDLRSIAGKISDRSLKILRNEFRRRERKYSN